MRSEDVLAALLGNAVWQWESETFREELLDIGTLHIIGLLHLNNFQDLSGVSVLGAIEYYAKIGHIHEPT